MTSSSEGQANVVLVEVDGTLIDDRQVQLDLRNYVESICGESCRERYFHILERLQRVLGYNDYLGALQRYRIEYPGDSEVLSLPSFLLDYPFANRLYPEALTVLRRLQSWRRTVVLSEGDAIFQPRKIERSGIHAAVEGRVLIYLHKEDAVEDLEARYPGHRYILVDHNPEKLAAFRNIWGSRLFTILVRHGISAEDQKIRFIPDLAVENIAELLDVDFAHLLAGSPVQAAR
jgi:FMN phosphatase YigB (HAD superfamily)